MLDLPIAQCYKDAVLIQSHKKTSPHELSLPAIVDFFRLDATRKLDPTRRAAMGQFFTPQSVAKHMASMFHLNDQVVHLLDPGAGVGSLTAAFVEDICKRRSNRPASLKVTAYEIDPGLVNYLADTLQACHQACREAGIKFVATIRCEDFLGASISMLRQDLFDSSPEMFNCVIMNPPYHKLNSDSEARRILRTVGIETSNFYTSFLWLAARLLEPHGELVAITPRSFCNGPYFLPFRKALIETTGLYKFHEFESRKRAFRDDDVLQENIIFHAVKGVPQPATVEISSGIGPEDPYALREDVPFSQVVNPRDSELVIHLALKDETANPAGKLKALPHTLNDLDLVVSTGRVVDFRATKLLRNTTGPKKAPLLYPGNLVEGFAKWPIPHKKRALAIANLPEAEDLLIPSAVYVLVKRFSAKEERRRIVAALYDPRRVRGKVVGIENHLNYFHCHGKGISRALAKGLVAYLNSTAVDEYFRQFSGHTQVNAADLRRLPYPSYDELVALGESINGVFPHQSELDHLVEEALFPMAKEAAPHARIQEALTILKALDFPREQQNERSALTLLALLDLTPEKSWGQASNPLCGITQMMNFFSKNYGKTYAPNTRETVRRQTVHQFLQAGLIVENPDNPTRPVNSPKSVYQISPRALELLQVYGSKSWEARLGLYHKEITALAKQYAKARDMQRISVTLAPGKTIMLSPGGQNVLVKLIVEEFCSRFTPGGELIYVGDTDQKWAYFEETKLAELGVEIEAHGKMPDVVVYHRAKNWLVLIEAVTSHGPVNPKRHHELKELFAHSRAGLVFVTAFMTRRDMVKYLNDISWETEVWVAEAVSHLIHFNGERFLGPHQT